jgi:hypothetical protein
MKFNEKLCLIKKDRKLGQNKFRVKKKNCTFNLQMYLFFGDIDEFNFNDLNSGDIY